MVSHHGEKTNQNKSLVTVPDKIKENFKVVVDDGESGRPNIYRHHQNYANGITLQHGLAVVRKMSVDTIRSKKCAHDRPLKSYPTQGPIVQLDRQLPIRHFFI
eukprot:Lithocolla_globosa_v1_NODE_11336_length_517_cov_1.387446.p2 type:complete len:103 gc:universal NODE_11336_length_517_cov_1.387446:335-27(-)